MTTLTFQLTIDETNVILAGLQELPAKLCNPLTKKLVEQATPQLTTETGTEKTLEVSSSVTAQESFS